MLLSQKKQLIPLIILLGLMLIFYLFGWNQALTFDVIKYHHNELTEYVNNHPILTPFMFLGAYIVATALSIPGIIFLNLLGGFLFPQPFSTLYVVIGATIGAMILFLTLKKSLGGLIEEKRGPLLTKLDKTFTRNAINYLLFLRFVPLFPFWISNVVPAFFQTELKTYLWTTLIGITPGCFLFTQAGRGLNTLFESSEKFAFQTFLNPNFKLALIGLGFSCLLPIFFKRRKREK